MPDGQRQAPLVARWHDAADPPRPDAFAKGADVRRHHRSTVRQRLVEDSTLRGEGRVGQDQQPTPVEERGHLVLADVPVDQLDAAGREHPDHPPDQFEVLGHLGLTGDRQVAVGELAQCPEQDVDPLVRPEHPEAEAADAAGPSRLAASPRSDEPHARPRGA